MREKVATKASPWIEGWGRVVDNPHASLSWTPHPVASVHRNDGMNGDNFYQLETDVVAAYTCALRWKVSGDAAYAEKAVEIMNAWSAQLKEITWSDGHYDGSLVAGLQGYQFANAGELLRTYSGWKPEDFARFKTMMMNVFSSRAYFLNHSASSVLVYSSWDLCSMASTLATAVLADDRELFDTVVDFFYHGLGNGALAMTVPYVHPGYLGQTQESGRDQGHNTLSIGLLGAVAEMAWNQGVDLYGFDNNRVLAAAEYVARGNLIESGSSSFYAMPFAFYGNGNVADTAFATGSRGLRRPEWTLFYHHYANRKGLSAPFSRRFMAATSPEGGGGDYGEDSGGYNLLGFGTLTFTRDDYHGVEVPSGLTAQAVDGKAVLSWWGTASSTQYTVLRSEIPSGPYDVVATGITEPRTYTDAPGPGVFYYVVKAMTPAGETGPSNEARAITGTKLHTWLTFDEGAGTTAGDATGQGHAGVLHGGTSWVAGKTGSAVAFDGHDGSVSLPDGFLSGLADFSIAAWVYLDELAMSRVFDFGTGLGQYMMLIPKDKGLYGITTNLGVGEQRITGDTTLPTGRWAHLAVTLKGQLGTLYLDGVAIGTHPVMWLSPLRLGATTRNWLGRSQYAVNPYFKGRIDDFRIYWGALTPAQVASLAGK